MYAQPTHQATYSSSPNMYSSRWVFSQLIEALGVIILFSTFDVVLCHNIEFRFYGF